MPDTSRPFLLISTRPEDEAAAAELISFREKMELDDTGLIQHRLESQPLNDLNLDEWSGILLGGSPFNASDAWKTPLQLRVEADLARLMNQVIAEDFPMFGACYGVGTVGTAIGANIDDTFGEKPRVIEVGLTEKGRKDPMLEGLPERFSTMVGHKEAIALLPAEAEVLVQGEHCPIQMFRYLRNIYATQFHPELSPEAFAQRLRIYADAGYYEPGELSDILATTRGVDLTVDDRVLLNFARTYAR
ncbi:glutamine amidotransferase [Corynebacterium alimapuense]|uniref:Glutamine amidotransferase n=1 Tax=Corynebacterium alimapuense TaxID=1576874 RepID=A0A3M8K7Q1_9CORY|nr:glutamine amidotransferase [Corynebacterium alimapuense]RNE49180.1 glutamine amidotransferase [Corynebacterium alimapuense]